MKRIIRESVFETNSSSTHAVTIKRKQPDEKWRNISEMYNSEREIRSPLEKMLFTWAFECYDFQACEIAWAINDDTDEETAKEYKEALQEATQGHNLFKRVLLEECGKYQIFNHEEALALMNNAEMDSYNHPVCCRYFCNDVLDYCTCNIDLFEIGYFLLGRHFRGVYETEDGTRLFAEKLFDKNVYYLLKENNLGGIDNVCYLIN